MSRSGAQEPLVKVGSLGGGIQSTTLALMACMGLIEKPWAVIFSDTGWESQATYRHLSRLESVVKRAGIKWLVTRPRRGVREDHMAGRHQMPLFTDGGGRLPRHCSGDYKRDPISALLRRLLGMRPRSRWPRGTPPAIEQWIGYSTDESRRANGHPWAWAYSHYPLILELQMSRIDCERWLLDHGWRVPRSSCVCCPNQDNDRWRQLRDQEPDTWADLIEFDRAIRNNGDNGMPMFAVFQYGDEGFCLSTVGQDGADCGNCGLGDTWAPSQCSMGNPCEIDGFCVDGSGRCDCAREGKQ